MSRKKKGKSKRRRLELVRPDCAGIDIGKDFHCAAVDPGRFEDPVRRFGTPAPGLEGMAALPGECGAGRWAMESTGLLDSSL